MHGLLAIGEALDLVLARVRPLAGESVPLASASGRVLAEPTAALPEAARPADHRNLMAESVGLYGLRRASTLQGENKSPGLTFLLDITQILTELLASKSLNSEEIRVTIVPDRPLPDSITIVVGRVSIFTTSSA